MLPRCYLKFLYWKDRFSCCSIIVYETHFFRGIRMEKKIQNCMCYAWKTPFWRTKTWLEKVEFVMFWCLMWFKMRQTACKLLHISSLLVLLKIYSVGNDFKDTFKVISPKSAKQMPLFTSTVGIPCMLIFLAPNK